MHITMDVSDDLSLPIVLSHALYTNKPRRGLWMRQNPDVKNLVKFLENM